MENEKEETKFHQITPTLGYGYDEEQVMKHIYEHEEASKHDYTVIREDPNFGDGEWSLEDLHIRWEESQQVVTERITFDGVPFFVLKRKVLGCHFGSQRIKHEKGSEDKKDGNFWKKSTCPFTITLKEVIRFPDYKISNETAIEKRKWAKVLREDVINGAARFERRIYVEIPDASCHVHRDNVKKPKTKQSSDVHCFICNISLQKPSKSRVDLFSGETRTSHRQLEVYKAVGSVLSEELDVNTAHSTTICSRCFSLIDDIDSLEEQLGIKKQMVIGKYKQTISVVSEQVANPPKSQCKKEVEQSKRTGAGQEHDLGKSDGQKKGTGRPRGRPRKSIPESPKESLSIKVDNKSAKEDHKNKNTGRECDQGKCGPGNRPSRHRVKPRRYASDSDDDYGPIKREIDSSEEDENSKDVPPFDTPMEFPSTISTIKNEYLSDDQDMSEEHQPKIEANVTVEEAVMPFIEFAVTEDDSDSIKREKTVEFDTFVIENMEEIEEGGRPALLSCRKCKKKFVKKMTLRKHMEEVHTGETPFECKVCEKSFPTRAALGGHKKSHMFIDKYVCEICSKGVTSRRKLEVHMKSHGVSRKFVCELCGRTLPSQKRLDSHVLKHTDSRPYMCEICGYTFREKSNLHYHIKSTHLQEKNYHCDLCKKSFDRKRVLMYHINSVHTGERPYKCKLCSASFVYPHYMKKHLRKHTGAKPFQCHICGKSFSARENRNAHMFTHSDIKPYECKVCGAGFLRKPLCAAHIADHHIELGRIKDYITINSPCMLVDASKQNMNLKSSHDEAAEAVQALTMDEDVSHEVFEKSVEIDKDTKVIKVSSRPIHVNETKESTHFVIHAANIGDRDENLENFFSSLQTQVVELHSEDF